MKFIHLADLHLGKHLANYSLLPDQRHILEKIIEEAEDFKPDCWLICGDVFDRSVPSEEAVILYDWFISACAAIAPVYMIAGNHDSGNRLELFKEALSESKIYIAGSYKGELEKEVLQVGEEKVNIYMLPYFHPADLRKFTKKKVGSYQEALDLILDDVALNPDELNILLSHQYYTSRDQDNSERLELGSLEEISIKSLEGFDYVALGHLHNRQKVGSERIRYCGTPLKYNLNDKTKRLDLINLTKDTIEIDSRFLKPKRDIYVIEDTFENLMKREGVDKNYVVIHLKNTESVLNAKASLLKKFPNLVQIVFNNTAQGELSQGLDSEDIKKLKPIELLEQFSQTNGKKLTNEEIKLAQAIFDDLEREVGLETDKA